MSSFFAILQTMLIFSLPCFGQTPSAGWRATRSDINTTVEKLVRAIDPVAQIKIEVKRLDKADAVNMPGTPFLLRDVNVSSRDNGSRFDLVYVTVFSNSPAMSPNVKNLIIELLRGFAPTIRVNVKPLPKEIDAQLTANQQPRPWEKAFIDSVAQISAQFAADGKGSIPQFLRLNARRSKLILYALLAFFTLALVMGVMWIKSQKRTLIAIENGFRQLAWVFENGPNESALRIDAGPQRGDYNTTRPALPASSSGQQDRMAHMPEESLLALLTDCYWSSCDSYGAFLWQRIPYNLKISLIRRMPELANYGSFLVTIPEENLDLDQHPAYLHPLPLWDTDQHALTKMVREQPGLLNRLSPLRLTSLDLSPSERLVLYEQSRNSRGLTELEAELVQSTPRELQRSLPMEIHSIEDEREVLAMAAKSPEIIKQVPSLGWLLQLEEHQSIDILRQISARDLAAAWIGPEDVLQSLSVFVGEKKMAMVTSYLASNPPSRQAPAFVAIHRMVLAVLNDAEPILTTDEVADHAA